MATAKFYDWKKRRNVKCEVKSKHSTGTFEQTYWIAGVKDNLEDTKVSREEYEAYDVPETGNQHNDYLRKMEKLRESGKSELPRDWKRMSVEKQCEYLDGLLKEILEYNHDDYSGSLRIFERF